MEADGFLHKPEEGVYIEPLSDTPKEGKGQ
jgi:hypothetical protein